MGINKGKYLDGTAWHVETLSRQKNDPKRHQTRCIHYASGSKYCSFRSAKCVGSSHCPHYQESSTVESGASLSTHFDQIKNASVQAPSQTDYVKPLPLSILIETYGLPLKLKKGNWGTDTYFIAMKTEPSGLISGRALYNGIELPFVTYPSTEQMVLIENVKPKRTPKSSIPNKKKS